MRVTQKPDAEQTAPDMNDHSTILKEKETVKDMEGIDPGLVALMKDSGKDGNDNTLLLFLLLIMGVGKGGSGFGGGDTSCCPPTTLEQLNDAQNALTAQAINNNNNSNDHFLQASDAAARNQLANQTNSMNTNAAIASANSTNLIGQKDITAAIADCCCRNLIEQKETQNRIDKCCCETQNAIAMQTQVLSTQICQDGDKTRSLITANKIDDLQAALTDQKIANSNLTQTTILQASIRDNCSPHHPWWGGGGGNGGPPGPPVV